MSDEDHKAAMQARAAERADIPVGVLSELLALDEELGDFNLPGVKAAFTQRVAEILEAAAAAAAITAEAQAEAEAAGAAS